jgi:hypothetical protein
MLDNFCPVTSILNHLYGCGSRLCLNFSNPKHSIKIGVSAVKTNLIILLSFIFSVLENKTALILQGVTSQDILNHLYLFLFSQGQALVL